ncbi:ABC transporter ATP-binding protein [Kribbella sandramycini]|uniref:ABC transporter ATP-binding protein n=1 Tax=Kribbella sandramycini TaxID=60450 RepID=A0A7Y4KYZ6_9ACTN|nr:ABC transporter ATP-binding protein [Kribbella sandramycini]MBB6564992.1 molybdate transport system ATP-binding protein [Kribbella sandramycini]NOL41264.1 ABC transporter ATP-binding protein [Kribbella sandramycini]
MTLYADLQVTRGTFELDIDLTIAPGEVVALLGPNGAGKTTALRAIAGLLPLNAGRISLDDDRWDEPPKTFRTPDRRPIGVVFQDYLLFDHLSCLENVAFGLRARGIDKHLARTEAARWLETVGLAEYGRRRPRSLSGGQAQRVALARALATSPDVLLLDEPLAALDASTTLHVRAELGQHLQRFTGRTLLVTHDPLDAMVLADRLVIIEAGRIVQDGAPAEIARRPRTEYVAQLVGLNLYRGTATGTRVALSDGGTITLAEPADGPVHVAFPPIAVSLYPEPPSGSPRNTWPATVTGIEQHAHTVRLTLDAAPSGPSTLLADITPAALADLHPTPGQLLHATLKATEVTSYPT